MRRFSNVIVGLLAAGVCAFITVMCLDASFESQLYNLIVLGIMLLIVLISASVGLGRMGTVRAGLDRASERLMEIHGGNGSLADITRPGSELFEVDYLDEKYQEYLAYLRKSNSPADIGDYIGEYEINNYTHRRLLELVPDILTSLGILGTFVGLVWGLRGFDPVSYEAMTGSISSLIDGIKVAFVTSIYGLSLSMAFSFWLRGSSGAVSESLDNFQDKYYLCAVPPTDTSALNNILINQREQTEAIRGMSASVSEEIGGQLDRCMEEQIGPALGAMENSMANFTEVVTYNQEQMMDRIADSVMKSMKSEFAGEMAELRVVLKETTRTQKEYVRFMSDAQAQFRTEFQECEQSMTKAMDAAARAQAENTEAVGAAQRDVMDNMRVQQEHLREFVDYMSQIMDRMNRINDASQATLEAATARIGEVSFRAQSEAMDEMNQNIEHLIAVMERQQRQQSKKKGILPF